MNPSRSAPPDTIPPADRACTGVIPAGSAEERTDALLAAIVAAGSDALHGPDRQDLGGILAGREHLPPRTEPHPVWWDSESGGLNLKGVVLRSVMLSHAILDHANLRGADLSGCMARSADLSQTIIEEANFAGADCGGVVFTGAKAGEVNFEGAMLEDARFEESSLRFANLRDALIDGTIFTGADLWGAVLDGAEADEAVFCRARLDEASLAGADCTAADFTDASLKKVTLDGATLRAANLTGARLEGASLRNADLSRASLPRVNLSSCDLTGVRLAGAWLENTRVRMDQFGGALGEETAGDFDAARQAYIVIEQNFRSLGDNEGERWAFLKRRRMAKMLARERARLAWAAHHWKMALGQTVSWASDVFVEWLCGYGESLGRVVRAFLCTMLAFAAFYGITGTLTRVAGPAVGGSRIVTHQIFDLLVFSFLNIMSTSAPDVGIKPNTEVIFLVASLQGALGIVLIGLFGYVLGNRMHR